MPDAINPLWISPERFSEYLAAAGGDDQRASRLYEWNASASAALFELIAHFEVLLRNSIVRELDRAGSSTAIPPGTPWLQGAKQIDEVVSRLQARKQPTTAGRVYAGLTFGFWRTMFATAQEELWRHSLRHVFRHARADRSVLAEYLDSINKLRNRIAHHGSLLDYDIAVEAQKLFRLASWLDPQAETWLRSIERVTALAAQRPVTVSRNTVIVHGADAWKLYKTLRQPAFLFPAGRSIRVTEHLSFYADSEVQTLVPKVRRWYDAVDWNAANAKRLSKTGDPDDEVLAGVIKASLNNGWKASTYQVMLLTPAGDAETVTLPSPIAHTRTGRGSAFVTSHRYVALSALRSARDTSELSR